MKKVITIIGIFGLILVQAQVGINTDTPQATLDIKSEASTPKALKITNSANAEIVTVTDEGNVGIGTATPQAKLEILGNTLNALGKRVAALSIKDSDYLYTDGALQTRILFKDKNDTIVGGIGELSEGKKFSFVGKHGYEVELLNYGAGNSFVGGLKLMSSGRTGIYDRATASWYYSTTGAAYSSSNAQLAVRTNNNRAIEIGNDRKINLNILNDGRIVYGYDDLSSVGNHLININQKTQSQRNGILLSNNDFGPGEASAKMSIHSGNGSGRMSSNKNIDIFIDDDNNTNNARFAIHKDNQFVGSPSVELFRFHENGEAYKSGGGSWAVLSDKRSKENIVNFTKGLKELLQVRPVNFKYKKEFAVANKTYTGVIAQELEKIAPSMVSETERGNIKDFKTVDPNEFTYMLINAVKELKQQNDKQQKEIDELKTLVKELQLKIK